MQPTREAMLKQLSQIIDPDLKKDIVTLGFVKRLECGPEGRVEVDLCLTTPACPIKEEFRAQARALIGELPGVSEVTVNLTSEVRSAAPVQGKRTPEGVRQILAIGSGKGGVGKSTVAVNLAACLARQGARVGLLDADIYGPSVPMLMGVSEPLKTDGKRILPALAHGVKIMSMGFLAKGDEPLIWRGPMAHKALEQSLFDVDWGEIDYLLVDLPPGTGDVHLTLAQSTPLAGSVIVSTPQDLGLMISRKTLRMFQKTGVPVLGIIENMSYYICPNCAHPDDIFGSGTVEEAAVELGIDFLGALPIEPQVRRLADQGVPVVVGDPDSESSKIYQRIAGALVRQMSIRAERDPVNEPRSACGSAA